MLYELAQVDPNKLWKKTFKILKKEKFLKEELQLAGHMDEYMPQFINFFKRKFYNEKFKNNKSKG